MSDVPVRGGVLIMAGGTGGHVFPALAVADKLIGAGISVQWLGTEKGIEHRVIPERGIVLNYISVSGLRGKGLAKLLLAPFRLLQALLQAMQHISRVRPACVLGMGGFASGPGGIAAWLLRKPLVIHEQNAVAGMTNKVLARFSRRVFCAFPQAFAGTGTAEKYQWVGNPLRASVLQIEPPETRFGQRHGPIRVLVLGGSLGAQALNEVVPQAISQLSDLPRPEVWHQTGANKLRDTQQRYQSLAVASRCVEFIDDMDAAYGWADLIICRAGALTISEIASVGLGAILVPYPHAVDDHQTENAKLLVEAEAAVLLPQSELTAERLGELLTSLLDRSSLQSMAEKSTRVARRDAAEQVSAYCMEFCHD